MLIKLLNYSIGFLGVAIFFVVFFFLMMPHFIDGMLKTHRQAKKYDKKLDAIRNERRD